MKNNDGCLYRLVVYDFCAFMDKMIGTHILWGSAFMLRLFFSHSFNSHNNPMKWFAIIIVDTKKVKDREIKYFKNHLASEWLSQDLALGLIPKHLCFKQIIIILYYQQ